MSKCKTPNTSSADLLQMSTTNPIIDLSNDDSPERTRRRHGSIMDDMRNYGEVCRQSAAADVIDLVNEPSSPGDLKPKSRNVCNPYNQSKPMRQQSPPQKRRRSGSKTEESSASRNNVASAGPLRPSERSRDGGLVTYNLLELVDRFRNKNVLTLNGQSSQSTSETIHPRQPLHYTQNDKWSCGFRNLQMLISSMPSSLDPIFPNGPPTLNELQSSFEVLWAEGFDPNGANHHNSKMVGKTGKISWIGAVEVWSYLSFRGIDATIVQFANTMENRSAIGSFVWAYFSRFGTDCRCQMRQNDRTSYQYAQQLIDAARQIRSKADDTSSSCSCTLFPLYLQWAGHSVTIVGIRRENCIGSNGAPTIRYHLIVFDPQKNGEVLGNKLANELNKRSDQRQTSCLRFMELSPERLIGKDTQVLLTTGRLISDGEREQCKERVSCISFRV